MEERGLKACGICRIDPTTEDRFCCVCLEHLCDGQHKSWSVCWSCNDKFGEDNIYQRDEQGRLIDPEKQTPILTCICGKRWNTFCGINAMKSLQEHGLIGMKNCNYSGTQIRKANR